VATEKDDPFAPLPVRTGDAQGKSTENRWLGKLGQERADSWATRVQNNPDGSVTRLKTRGGAPEFITEPTEPRDDAPAIAFAFPEYDLDIYGSVAQTSPGTIIKTAFKLTGKYLPRGAGVNTPIATTPEPAAGRERDTTVNVLQADGRGKWVGVVPRHNGAIYPPAMYTFYVWTGTKSTAYLDYVTEEFYFMRHVGSCRVDGARKDFFIEDRPFDLGGDSLLRQKAYVLTKSGGALTVTPLPDFPFTTDRAYYYSGCGFVAPDKPAILLAETPGDNTMLLKLFVFNGSGWDVFDVSACMAGHSGVAWNFGGANVIPVSSTKILVGPKWSYPRTGDIYYRNGYGVLDTSTGVTTSITYYDLAVSEPRALDLYQFEKESWVESITAWPRVSPYNTHSPIGRRLRYTIDGGGSFVDFTASWGYGLPYGIEFAAATSVKPNGDFSGLGFVVPEWYTIDGNGRYIFGAKVKTTADMAYFDTISPTVFTLVREQPVGFFALGSGDAYSPIDVVCPWRRDSSKTPPAYWFE
jgi:hypothetical protein